MKYLHTTSSIRRRPFGSALILTVVLTSLLAIIGVLFLMVGRLDQIASSAASDGENLDLAVGTVIDRLRDELVQDVPGVVPDPNRERDYHDYPGSEDVWLASLEPNDAQMWPQISDVTGYLRFRGWATNNIAIDDSEPNVLFQPVIPPNRPIAIGPNGVLLEQLADADGDGVADSKWFEIDSISSTKGRPVYAAVRVIDNVGMLNVNMGPGFNPYDPSIQKPAPQTNIDGSSQLHINTMALAGPRGMMPRPADRADLLLARSGYGRSVDPNNLAAYEQNVIWEFGAPAGYTPFDISDELELRYRFLLNHAAIDTRIEEWGTEFRSGTIWTPVEQGGKALDDWFLRASDDGSLDPNYAFRHLATTCSMDRIIDPNGRKMVNVNAADPNSLRDVIARALLDANPAMLDATDRAAQIAANIIDSVDPDSDITYVAGNTSLKYGFEQPCVYISEVACNHVEDPDGTEYYSYAIELFKPYRDDPDPGGNWRLDVDGVRMGINWTGSRWFNVVLSQDPSGRAPLVVNFNDPTYPGPGTAQSRTFSFDVGSTIRLLRRADDGADICVDQYTVPPMVAGGWLYENVGGRSIERDIQKHKPIRKLWAANTQAGTPSLGHSNSYPPSPDPDGRQVQAHPANKPFTCIGEIGMVLDANGYNVNAGLAETDLLLDLQNPMYARILNYLTVIDPADHDHPTQETRVKGRININTAPWYVMEQLPWMSMDPNIARAAQAYRDGVVRGFRSIAEITYVPEIGFYKLGQPGDLPDYPDLTYDHSGSPDGAVDDMEERDLIFHRISNLITVRSDVFTAYILVRVGADGPQRRVVAILDRSNVFSAADKPRILALHPVEDPR